MKKMNLKYSSLYTLAVLLFALHGLNAQASVVLYAEGADLPSAADPFTPLPLGVLASPEISSVIGSLPGGSDSDAFSFVVAPGSQLSSIILTDWSTTNTGNFIMVFDGIFKQPGSLSNVGLDILPIFTSSPVGPGTHTFFLATGTGVISSYQLDFVTTSTVPAPAAVWLFGTALAGIFGVGKMRKKV